MSDRRWSARLPLAIGLSTVFLMLGGIGAWSIGTQIAGAVVATGQVRVESDRQVVQHPDGGVVGAIHARDGDRVESGDILVRLDDTFLKSELAVVERQLMELYARKVRLEAERDGAELPAFDTPDHFTQLDAGWVAGQIAGQRNLFDARRTSLAKEIEQLREQLAQTEDQIAGSAAQLDALDTQRTIIAEELADLDNLLRKGLIEMGRLRELRREEARIEGEIGRLTASIAEARGRISAIEIEILKLSDRRREEAIGELRDLRYSEIELEERRIALQERLSRLDVRAPVAGIVFGSRIFALQSVVRAAEPMLYVVPADQPLEVSARIDPIHVDQVFPGQPVSLRFTTFDQRRTPEITGAVRRVSADIVVDEATGERYYEAIVYPEAAALADLPEDLTLLPGMPVEAFLRTRERTPMAYLTQPLMNYFNRAFRED